MITEMDDTNTPDAAADWQPLDALLDGYPPSFDEWNAMRVLAGDVAGNFDEYLAEIDRQDDRHV